MVCVCVTNVIHNVSIQELAKGFVTATEEGEEEGKEAGEKKKNSVSDDPREATQSKRSKEIGFTGCYQEPPYCAGA